MRLGRTQLGIAAVAILCVAIAGALIIRNVHSERREPPSPSATMHRLQDPTPIAPFPSWRRGEGREYRLEMTSTVAAEGKPILGLQLSGDWLIAALDVTATETVLRGELRGPQFTNNAAVSSTDSAIEHFERGFGLQHFVELDGRGAVKGVSLPDRMPSFVQSVMRALITSTQFVAPTEAARAWSNEEADNLGRYRARYEQRTPYGWNKHKLGYTELLGDTTTFAGALASIDVRESRIDFNVNKSGVVRTLRFHERTLTKSRGPLPTMDATTTISLVLKSSVDVSAHVAAWTAASRQAEWGDAWSGASDATWRTDTDIARIGGRTLPDLLTALDRVHDDAPRATQKRARLYSGLAALLRQDPQAVQQALSRIRRGDRQASLLVDALGDGGSREAQVALCEIAGDSGITHKIRRGALVALSFVDSPTEVMLTSLAGLADHEDYGTQARYALGAAIYQLQGSDPERAAQALEQLTARLGHPALGEGEVVTQLVALGNAGHAGAMSDILPYLTDQSSAVRKAALRAMRRISDPVPDSYVADAMLRDPVAGVRATAAQVALQRKPSWALAEATRTALLQDPDEAVRLAALRVAIKWIGDSGTLRAVVSQVAEREQNRSIRALAVQALERAERADYGS